MTSTSNKKTAAKGLIHILRNAAIGISMMGFAHTVYANDQVQHQKLSKETMMAMQKIMKSDMQLMKPDLQKQVKGLSKKTKMALMKIIAGHSRRSNKLTLRQVMQEVLADYQSVMAGLATDNTEQAADSARRLANHRLPVGGLIPYLNKKDVTDAGLASLVGFNDMVEGNSLRLAAAADRGNVNEAAGYLGKIAEGCVGCHQVFRGQPGISDRLR